MNDWHRGALCAFDLETTGPEPLDARIVTACVATVDGSGGTEAAIDSWLLDPGVEIPEGATAIHGVSTEQARADGADATDGVAEIAAALDSAWAVGRPVIGHNVSYDLTVLNADLVRHGQPGLVVTGPVIDTLCLDKHVDKYRKGKRTLTATCEHYAVALDGAHDSTFDALASARIAWRICQRYPDIAAMDLAELHAAQVEWAAEQAAGLQEYFRKTDPTAVVDGTWPVRRATAAVSG